MKIVLIDDCYAILKLMEIYVKLYNSDLQIYTFKDPKKALSQIPEINPNIVISDFLMFDIDGIELIKELKQKISDCKFFLISSFLDEYIKNECFANDIVYFDNKITSFEDMKKILDEIL